MSYGPNEFLQALLAVREGRLSADEHEAMELYLLRRVQDKGTRGIEALLGSLDTTELGKIAVSGADDGITVRISRDGVDSILIKAAADEFSAYAIVNLHSTAPTATAIDPARGWFYSTWEAVQGDEYAELATRSKAERAVYWVALLEAQVMNGGFGQYLANSDGVYLTDTLACLESIGAPKTHSLLERAKAIAEGAESYDAAWDEFAGDYGKLDDAFMKSGEDLAALTAAAFQG